MSCSLGLRGSEKEMLKHKTFLLTSHWRLKWRLSLGNYKKNAPGLRLSVPWASLRVKLFPTMGNWWSHYYQSPQLITCTFHKFMPKSAAAAAFTFTNPFLGWLPIILWRSRSNPAGLIWLFLLGTAAKLWKQEWRGGTTNHNVTDSLLPTI